MRMGTKTNKRPGMPLKTFIAVIAAALPLLAAAAQTGAGVIIRPDMGQSRQQQIADERECHNIAIRESGYDPAGDDAIKSCLEDHHRIIRSPVMRGAARGMATGGPAGAAVGAALARRKQLQKAAGGGGGSASDPIQAARQRYAGFVFDCLAKKGYTIEDTGSE